MRSRNKHVNHTVQELSINERKYDYVNSRNHMRTSELCGVQIDRCMNNRVNHNWQQITRVHAIGWNQAIGKPALIIDTRSSVFVYSTTINEIRTVRMRVHVRGVFVRPV